MKIGIESVSLFNRWLKKVKGAIRSVKFLSELRSREVFSCGDEDE